MLLTHVVLAIVMLPMILITLFRAYRREWNRHKRIARPTYWIWMYVSVTGVVIYFVLYHIAPSST
jgi:protein SCO1/2/putative membrane protein